MLEVAIAAFKTVQAMDEDPNLPELRFDTKLLAHKVQKQVVEACGGDEAKAKEIMCAVLAVSPEELEHVSHIKHSKAELMLMIAKGEADLEAEREKALAAKAEEERQLAASETEETEQPQDECDEKTDGEEGE